MADRSPYREVTKVTLVIETTHSEFRIVSSDEENGWQTVASLAEGVCTLLRKYAERIGDYGVAHFDGQPIIGVNGQTVGRITIEREA